MLTFVACLALSAAPPALRLDAHGDALPVGAVARLGTVRFRHGAVVTHAAFSHDGKLVASAAGMPDWSVILRDRATGREVNRLRLKTPPGHLRFSPDDRRLVIAHGCDRESAATIWDINADTAEAVAHGIAGGVFGPLMQCARVSPDGRDLVWSDDAAITRLNLKDKGTTTYRLPKGLIYGTFRTSPRPATAWARDGKIGVFDLANGNDVFAEAFAADAAGTSAKAAFGDDGRLVALGTGPGVVTVREADTGKLVARLKGGSEGWASLAISPDNRTVAGSNRDGQLVLWDLKTGAVTGRHSRPRSKYFGWDVLTFAPDSKALAATDGMNATCHVRILDGRTAKPLFPEAAVGGAVGSALFLADGRMVLSSSGGQERAELTLWDAPTGKAHGVRFDTTGMYSVCPPAVSPDGTRVAAGDGYAPCEVREWDIRTGRIIGSYFGGGEHTMSVEYSADGRRLLACDFAGASMHDTRTKAQLFRIASEGKERSYSASFTPDGSRFLVHGPTVRSFDAVTGESAGKVPTDVRLPSYTVTSPDGRFRATAGAFDHPVLRETLTGKLLYLPSGMEWTWAFAFLPDGRGVVRSGVDGVTLHDLADRRLVARLPMTGQFGAVAVSPDGRYLVAVGGEHGTATVFDLRPLTPTADPAPLERERLWRDLLDESPAVAWWAVRRLADAPEDAVPLLAEKLRPRPVPKDVDRLVADLDAEEFATRKRAAEALSRIGRVAEAALRRALRGRPSVETASVAGELLDRLADGETDPERWRESRAVAALEHANTAEARNLLARLAAGPAAATLTAEAKAALSRIDAKGRAPR